MYNFSWNEFQKNACIESESVLFLTELCCLFLKNCLPVKLQYIEDYTVSTSPFAAINEGKCHEHQSYIHVNRGS